ncbi:hypothetical protein [Treponema sp. R80B11-R83G3]
MKKFVLVTILVLCFIFSGCIDIFQHLTKDNNGNEKNTIKVTVSKTIFAMASGLYGYSNDIDYEKLFDENDMNTLDMKEYNQFGATLKKINDTMDVGYLFDINMDYRDKNVVNKINSSNASFIHKYNGKNIIIHIAKLGDNSSSSSDNEMVALLLATGKYRLAINKKCIANVSKVVIKTIKDETEINFLDLFDEYLIEIPIPIIVMSDIDIIIYSK